MHSPSDRFARRAPAYPPVAAQPGAGRMTDAQQTRDLVRRFYATYHSADRDAIEKLLSHDFRFTSPYDDAIDRATYFERCWSHAGTFAYLDVKELLIEGDTCFVLYEGAAANGSRFHNTERLQLENGRIRSVEVFFGRPQGETSDAGSDIRALVERQAQAIRDKDADGVMIHNAPDMLSFDIVAPLRQRGAEVVRERLQHWFDAFDGAIGCEVRELEVATSSDTAFAHFLQRFSGTNTSGMAIDMWVRVTMGLRRIDGRWLIAHEHMSDPFDPGSGMALTQLAP